MFSEMAGGGTNVIGAGMTGHFQQHPYQFAGSCVMNLSRIWSMVGRGSKRPVFLKSLNMKESWMTDADNKRDAREDI